MILLLSQREDRTVDYLEEKLKETSFDYVRVNVDDYGSLVTSRFSTSTESGIIVKGKVCTFSGIFSKYSTSLSANSLSTVPAEYARYAKQEASDTLLGTLLNHDTLWMNLPECAHKASIKINQLRYAKNVGLKVPDTLVSSQKNDLIDFWHSKKGNVITKAVHKGWLGTEEGSSKQTVVYTSKVEEFGLAKIAEVNFPPILLQELIDKVCDLRVVVVKDKCFTAKIISSEVDWRKDITIVENSTRYFLPEVIESKCIDVVKSLGLNFGVLDLVVGKDENIFFLEVNQQGGWVWMEHNLNFPIRETIIDRLYRG